MGELDVKDFNQRIILGGIALLLFGLILAVTKTDVLAYIVGGLGLFLSLVGCFAPEGQGDNNSNQP